MELGPAGNGAADGRLVTRLRLRNFKSIGRCDVELGQLTFLVGPNGSGKSNFLDALRFAADALRSSLDHAVRERGGIREVRRRSGGHPNHFGIRIDFRLRDALGHYAFEVGAEKGEGFSVRREECYVVPHCGDGAPERFVVESGAVRSTTAVLPSVADRLYLVAAAGLPAFRPAYDALAAIEVYNLVPDRIRELQPPDSGELLRRDGSNLAAVLRTLESRAPHVKTRIEEYLAKVVPGVHGVRPIVLGSRETIEFLQDVGGAKAPWRFPAGNMSDGTLRALGVLTALFQGGAVGAARRLVGIEEPELALHPAAAGLLGDSLRDASDGAQVIVTSHSPDLLDDPEIGDSAVRAVLADQGETHIGPLDRTGRDMLRQHLYTAGELLRMDQLAPDPESSQPRQLVLFEEEPEP